MAGAIGSPGASGNFGPSGISYTFPGFGGPDYRAKGEVQNGLVAAFAAGVKYAVDKVLNGNGHDPAAIEKIILEAVAFRLAPSNSGLTSKMALLITTAGAVRVVPMESDPPPKYLSNDGQWELETTGEHSPFVVYRPMQMAYYGQTGYSVTGYCQHLQNLGGGLQTGATSSSIGLPSGLANALGL
jgi:hypothetical protein